MQIELVRIRGFGALVNKEYRFLNGLNVIYGENEIGKSTIAEFIRAMLYGLESGVRDVRVNERLRYTPLSGAEMGGMMEFNHNGKKYTVDRVFGKTKSADRLNVTDGITGAVLDTTPADIIGMNNDSYLKTLYIKQLSTKPELAKDDEILARLINLSQGGREQDSYQKAREILVDANKTLTGKQKGLIPELNARIAMLQSERVGQEQTAADGSFVTEEIAELTNEKDRLTKEASHRSEERTYREKYSQWKMDRQQSTLKLQVARNARENEHMAINNRIREQERQQKSYLLVTILVSVLAIACIAASFFIVPLIGVAVFGAIGAFLAFMSYRRRGKNLVKLDAERAAVTDLDNNEQDMLEAEYEDWFEQTLGTRDFNAIPVVIERYCDEYNMERQRKNDRIIEIVEQIRDIENKKKQEQSRPAVLIDQDIVSAQKKINEYQAKAASIQRAIEALDMAYSDMESDYAPKLNIETSKVLREVTEGKYVGVKADGIYSLTLVDNKGNQTRSEYMSCGCYDQIYFSLRMGIINLLDIKAPVIMDDALSLYDDSRHKAAMDYIATIENQVLLFTCQSREKAGNMINL